MIPKGKIVYHTVDITYNDLTGAQKQELVRNIHLLTSNDEVMYIIEGDGRYNPLWQELSHVFNIQLGYYGTKEALTYDFFQTLEKVLPSVYKGEAEYMFYAYGYPRGVRLFNKETTTLVSERQLYEITGTDFKATCGGDLTIELIELLMKKGHKSITITKL